MLRRATFALLRRVIDGALKALAATHSLTRGTEAEIRSRVRARLGSRVPAERLPAVEDRVVEFARRQRRLVESP
jgi:hypothetical protein